MAESSLTDTDTIKHRSITGALAFVSRTALLQVIGLVAFFFLGIFLDQAQLGIFFVIDATVGLLVYFSDIGLAGALIQKPHISQADIATTFTIQQVLALTLSILALVIAPWVADFYHYGSASIHLFYALVFAFFTASLKTIPSILLERDLEFNKLVTPQILENLIFYLTVVILAWQGKGIASYTGAVIARSLVGLVAIYLIKPWKPKLGFSLSSAKHLVRFGAPFQLNSILALFKDKLMIIFLGKVLAPQQVGLLGWAEKWALTPIRFFADPVLRVTFPAYARLQNHPKELKTAIEKSIFFISFLVFPAVLGMQSLAPSLLALIPSYTKWLPALTALGFYGINAMFSSVSITLTNTLNATGHTTTTLKLMIMWTALTWVLTPSLIVVFGFTGAAIASAITASSSLIAIYLVNRIIPINIIAGTVKPLFGSLIMFASVTSLAQLIPPSPTLVLAQIIIGSIVYASILTITARSQLLTELAIIKKYTRSFHP